MYFNFNQPISEVEISPRLSSKLTLYEFEFHFCFVFDTTLLVTALPRSHLFFSTSYWLWVSKKCQEWSPRGCPPASVVSSCVPCHWTSACNWSTSRSCRSVPVWLWRWSGSAWPGPPPTTGTGLKPAETSLQLLHRGQGCFKVKKNVLFLHTT